MKPRLYGKTKIQAVVLHGGPGAPGYMAPVARELSSSFRVLEPFQTKDTLEGQITELNQQINQVTKDHVVLIGSSWGATLALLYAGRYTNVSKVMIIGSCVYDEESSKKVKEIRFARMSPETNQTFDALVQEVNTYTNKNELFSKLADCFFESDTYDPLTKDLEVLECQQEINTKVWADFKKIRDNPGELAALFSKIQCPVVNIHGDHDPHILEGIQPFLESCLKEIKLVMLDRCGHYPWIERYARGWFFKVLRREIEKRAL